MLRDEGEAYARMLDEAGVDVTCVRYNGAIHDFALLNALRDVPGDGRGAPPGREPSSRATCG